MTRRYPFTTTLLVLIAALQLVGLWTANSLLQQLLQRVELETRGRWNAVADIVAVSFPRSEPHEETPVTLQRMEDLRRDYDLIALDLTRAGQHLRAAQRQPPDDVTTLSRPTAAGRITAVFDARSLSRLRATVLLLMSFSSATMLVASLVLLGYIANGIRTVFGARRELATAGLIGTADSTPPLLGYVRDVAQRFRQRQDELQLGHEVERRRAEDLDRVSRTLTRSLTSGFISIGREGLMLDMNAAAKEILGVATDFEVRGRTIREVIGATEFCATIETAIENRSNLNRSEVVESGHDDGPLILGLTTASLISDTSTYLGMVILFTDLTPVRSLEARLRDMQTLAELGHITAGIAHEFRNSLSTILGYLRLVRRSGTIDGDADAKLDRAEAEGRQLTAAVEQLLTFGRPQEPRKQRFDLAELVRSTAVRLTQSRTTAVEMTLPADRLEIDGDPVLMAVVIENLIRNALESIDQKGAPGRIDIRCRSSPRPTVVVSDSGVGLDPADAKRLFLPFQSGKPNGFGVGLALARKIVLLHGGSIRLTGTPGAGASATVELPPVA